MANVTEYLSGLANYNLAELGTFATVFLGSIGACLVMVLKAAGQSRCTSILWGCCEREPSDIADTENAGVGQSGVGGAAPAPVEQEANSARP